MLNIKKNYLIIKSLTSVIYQLLSDQTKQNLASQNIKNKINK